MTDRDGVTPALIERRDEFDCADCVERNAEQDRGRALHSLGDSARVTPVAVAVTLLMAAPSRSSAPEWAIILSTKMPAPGTSV